VWKRYLFANWVTYTEDSVLIKILAIKQLHCMHMCTPVYNNNICMLASFLQLKHRFNLSCKVLCVLCIYHITFCMFAWRNSVKVYRSCVIFHVCSHYTTILLAVTLTDHHTCLLMLVRCYINVVCYFYYFTPGRKFSKHAAVHLTKISSTSLINSPFTRWKMFQLEKNYGQPAVKDM